MQGASALLEKWVLLSAHECTTEGRGRTGFMPIGPGPGPGPGPMPGMSWGGPPGGPRGPPGPPGGAWRSSRWPCAKLHSSPRLHCPVAMNFWHSLVLYMGICEACSSATPATHWCTACIMSWMLLRAGSSGAQSHHVKARRMTRLYARRKHCIVQDQMASKALNPQSLTCNGLCAATMSNIGSYACRSTNIFASL